MRKEEYTIEELEFLLREMRKLQNENPKAKILYDIERERIYITFPLPKDFKEIQGLKLSKIIGDELNY